DVILTSLVGIVDDRGKRGRFPAARRARHQYKTFVKAGKFFHDRRQAQLVSREHLRRDLAEHCSYTVLLVEKVRAVPRLAGDFVAEINVDRFLEYLYFEFRRDLVKH